MNGVCLNCGLPFHRDEGVIEIRRVRQISADGVVTTDRWFEEHPGYAHRDCNAPHWPVSR